MRRRRQLSKNAIGFSGRHVPAPCTRSKDRPTRQTPRGGHKGLQLGGLPTPHPTQPPPLTGTPRMACGDLQERLQRELRDSLSLRRQGQSLMAVRKALPPALPPASSGPWAPA